MENFAKILNTLGAIFLIFGLGIILFQKSGIHLTKLPGDIIYQKGNTMLVLPIATCIVISLILSLLVWLLKKIL
jgi:hypothetical protein